MSVPHESPYALFVFGAGSYGRRYAEKYRNMPGFMGFLDNNPALDGTSVAGAAVYHPSRVATLCAGRIPVAIPAVVNDDDKELMRRDCLRLGIKCDIGIKQLAVRSGGYDKCPTVDELLDDPEESLSCDARRLAGTYFRSDFMFYETCESAVRCSGVWADDESRHIYRSLIRTRCFRNLLFMPARNVEYQYFSPIVPKKFYRSFVDCGAYLGGSLKNFRKVTGDDFDNCYLFEAFTPHYNSLMRNMGADPRIQAWNVALWNERAELSFRIPGGDAVICPSVARSASPCEKTTVQADSLDRILGDSPVTIITMDIEGAEPEALEGAVGIIRRQRPALAISTYHYDADQENSHLWRIPLWIHDLDLGYSLYCRHYSGNLNETVCYAVPND